jgi:TonB family protein
MPGSGLANRARDLVRGLDVLGGTPPAAPVRPGERRAVAQGAEREVPLRMYVESVRQKIERNGTLNGAQLGADRVRISPLVSLTLRSDGSVEDVTILRSSGRPDIDEAVRRVVRINARYSVFPPNVAANYDVIEIRRIWSFTEGLKLLEEMR